MTSQPSGVPDWPSAVRYLVRTTRFPDTSCVLEEVAQVPDGSCSFLMAGGVPVVTAPAEIDVITAGQLRARLAGWAARGHTTVVVDLADTQFCDCSGLHVLVRAHQQALAEGGGLRLVLPASGPVPRIFTLTGLDRVIPHFTSLEQALTQAPEGRVRPRGPRPSPGMRSRTEHDASTAGSASAEVDSASAEVDKAQPSRAANTAISAP